MSSYSLDLEKNSPAFGNELADAVKLTSDDTEAVAAQEPDLIIAFSTDEHLKELKDIAPVLVIEYGKSDYLVGKRKRLKLKKNSHHTLMPQQASLLWIFMTKLSTSMVITGGAEVN